METAPAARLHVVETLFPCLYPLLVLWYDGFMRENVVMVWPREFVHGHANPIIFLNVVTLLATAL